MKFIKTHRIIIIYILLLSIALFSFIISLPLIRNMTESQINHSVIILFEAMASILVIKLIIKVLKKHV